ncbi:MAG: hypothetical protein KGY39_07175 [Anaerolineales bacterium]|nr:hypothetical protein [Anaerolineales bacterium]MBS3753737.1 hypothetical protein [Anaerolineales bacterium]
MTKINKEVMYKMVRAIASVREEEIGCDDCFEKVDTFVDLELAGKEAGEALPLVKDHLERCQNCREEYEALLTAVRAMSEK